MGRCTLPSSATSPLVSSSRLRLLTKNQEPAPKGACLLQGELPGATAGAQGAASSGLPRRFWAEGGAGGAAPPTFPAWRLPPRRSCRGAPPGEPLPRPGDAAAPPPRPAQRAAVRPQRPAPGRSGRGLVTCPRRWRDRSDQFPPACRGAARADRRAVSERTLHRVRACCGSSRFWVTGEEGGAKPSLSGGWFPR